MSTFDQRLAAWSGIVFTVLFGAGLGCAGWIPLPTPNMSAEQVVAMYQANTNGIRLGMVLMVFGSVFYLAMTVVTAHQMKRMQGSTLAPTFQLVTGVVNMTTFFYGPLIMGVAAFRPDRSAEVTYALHDLGWLIFIMPFAPATFQCLSVALGVLSDQGREKVFPRWFGFMSLWAGLLFTPGGLVFFFKTGPFAWNGLLAFYIAATAFFVWIVALVILLLKAIKSQEA
jgi:hypothetical protein